MDVVIKREVVVTKNEVIEVKNLSHSYGKKVIYENLNLTISQGSVFGILGKNGVGKSTLINILMGYLRPNSGQCLIFGEDSHNLSAFNRKKIALLHEGFITYDFMSIEQIEQFFRAFYEDWNKQAFYDLIDLMGLEYEQKLSTLSFGQKSQVVLGSLFAQNARLLILDDYSMGLDAGYRRLLIDYLKEYIRKDSQSVLITSHVMSDLVGFIDSMAILQKGGDIYQSTLENFMKDFKCYEAPLNLDYDASKVHRAYKSGGKQYLFSFQKIVDLPEIACDFEEKFLGYVGRY